MVAAGDRLQIRSSLEEPEDFDGFAYRAYLARQGVAAIASSRGVEVVGHELGRSPTRCMARAGGLPA